MFSFAWFSYFFTNILSMIIDFNQFQYNKTFKYITGCIRYIRCIRCIKFLCLKIFQNIYFYLNNTGKLNILIFKKIARKHQNLNLKIFEGHGRDQSLRGTEGHKEHGVMKDTQSRKVANTYYNQDNTFIT